MGSSGRGTKFDRRKGPGEPTPPPYASPAYDYIRPPIDADNSFIDESAGDGSASGTARPQTGTIDDNSSSRAKESESGGDVTKSTRQGTKNTPSSTKNTRPTVRPQPQPTPKPETPAKTETPQKDDPPPEKPEPDESKKGSGGDRR